jgi:endonuclease YncB( thermonuclease family)
MDFSIYVGFVVNLYDPLNWDIDLLIPKNQLENFKNVFTSKYTYADEDGVEKEGVTYRCRIRGIIYEETSQSLRKMIRRDDVVYKVYVEMNQIIDRCNGWVACRIFGFDKYQRILVDIYDPVSKKNIGLNLLNLKNRGKFRRYINQA